MIDNRQRYAYRPPAPIFRDLGDYPPLLPAAEFIDILDEPRRSYSIAEARDYCARMAQRRYENVPVASRFVPEALRPHILAVYAFARAANDFTDDARFLPRREEALRTWEEQLSRAFHGEADHPIFVALRDTIEARDLPITPFDELMSAFRMDLSTFRYPTFADLRRYCDYGSVPLGRLLLYLFGYRDPALHRYADEMCVGLQLANFLQDLDLDFNGHRGRLYLPMEDLSHFGVTEGDLRRQRCTDAFVEMMRFQVARARSQLVRGRPLIDRVGPDLAFELELTWQSGQAVLNKIESVGYDIFQHRPVLNRADRARLLATALTRRWPRFIGPRGR